MISCEVIKNALGEFGITEFAVIPSSDVVLLAGKQLPEKYKNCIIYLIPYNTGEKINDAYNMGLFARSLDYHTFAKKVNEVLIEKLDRCCGGAFDFVSFCDSSPTDEKQTAMNAGLGVKGKNSLLINEKYGSYCFISEIYTTADAIECFVKEKKELCHNCTACQNACPVGAIDDNGFVKEKCLSFISQKKNKTEAELSLLKKHKTIWGCDLCQQSCPINKKARLSTIEYFKQDFISELSLETIKNLTDEEYKKRSFSYRKRLSVEENF